MDILISGAIGGLSALIAIITMKIIKKEQKWIFALIIAISFISIKSFFNPYIEQYKEYAYHDELLSKIEPFTTVKANDKDTYNKILDRFIAGYSTTDDKEVYFKKFVSSEVSILLNEKLKHSSREEIYKYFQNMIEALKYLRKYNNTYCYDWLFPTKYIGFDKIFTVELNEKIKNSYIDLIKNSYIKKDIKKEYSQSKELSEIGQVLSYKYGQDLSLLQNTNLIKNDNEKGLACDILIDLYTAIFSLDKDKAGDILIQITNDN
ncbi:hypothetical protein N5U04_09870 [Aliarcobacter butzleri]|nr:hypothetical protein [Aliarcobacter butzleri]MCT7549815.1 hypothetical protein [Aliarcobacter butzleri]MCT7559875.1 hypothetical protein [Aliarcobacter butzleri]